MSFAGTFGAAANLIPFGILSSPRYGQATGYDANGNLQFASGGGTTITPERVDDLRIIASATVLAALVNNTDDGTAADTGVLVSAAAAANQHGLPANFGVGRGNWTIDESRRLDVEVIAAQNTVAAVTNTGGPVVRQNLIGAGDVTYPIKNMSEVACEIMSIRVRLIHSIQE